MPPLPFGPHGSGQGGDILSILSGVLNATGINQALPGGGLQRFGSTLASDPRAAGQQYADWRGPFFGQNDYMMVPAGVWGSPMSSTLRTGPARSMQAQLKKQAMMDMYRDVQKSIDRAPTSSFLDNHIRDAQSELNMRRLGMGRDDLINRNLMQKTSDLAYKDQLNAGWEHLNSLFPDPNLMDAMPPVLQDQLRNLLTNARTAVSNRFQQQRRNTGRPITKGGAAPDVIEAHRAYIGKAIEQKANDLSQIAPRYSDRDAATLNKNANRLSLEAQQLPKRMPGELMNRRFLGGRHSPKN